MHTDGDGLNPVKVSDPHPLYMSLVKTGMSVQGLAQNMPHAGPFPTPFHRQRSNVMIVGDVAMLVEQQGA